MKLNENDAPWLSGPELIASGAPASETIVCVTPSRFVHVTVVPCFTVISCGLKAKDLIVIAPGPAAGAAVPVLCGTGPGEELHPASATARIKRDSTVRIMGNLEGKVILVP